MDHVAGVHPADGYLPPGFRFHPTDEELIAHYLLKKVLDSSFSSSAIAEVDLNKSEPWELPEKAKMGEKEWYFFSLRDRKYPTGLRTNRATEGGYWKATGKDREIFSSKTRSLVGMKKTLVFYRGRAPKGEKSSWVMHEFRLAGKFAYHFLSRTSKDEWVISRVFKKSSSLIGSSISSPGPKKTRIPIGSGPPLIPDPSSPSSSVSLPPLLDSHEPPHVTCFSTSAAFSAPNPPARFAGGIDLSVFPNLRSLQENLQLPAFPAANHAGGGSELEGLSEILNWPAAEESRAMEMEYMWSF